MENNMETALYIYIYIYIYGVKDVKDFQCSSAGLCNTRLDEGDAGAGASSDAATALGGAAGLPLAGVVFSLALTAASV